MLFAKRAFHHVPRKTSLRETKLGVLSPNDTADRHITVKVWQPLIRPLLMNWFPHSAKAPTGIEPV